MFVYVLVCVDLDSDDTSSRNKDSNSSPDAAAAASESTLKSVAPSHTDSDETDETDESDDDESHSSMSSSYVSAETLLLRSWATAEQACLSQCAERRLWGLRLVHLVAKSVGFETIPKSFWKVVPDMLTDWSIEVRQASFIIWSQRAGQSVQQLQRLHDAAG